MILLQSKKPGIALTLAMESLKCNDPPRIGHDIDFFPGGMIIEDDKA